MPSQPGDGRVRRGMQTTSSYYNFPDPGESRFAGRSGRGRDGPIPYNIFSSGNPRDGLFITHMQQSNISSPAAVKLVVLTVCALTALSALGFAYVVVMVTVKPLWLMFGFEMVTAVACILGVLFGLGKYQNGQGLALSCVGACIFVGAVLNQISTQGFLQTNDASGGIGLRWYLLTRLAAAASLAVIGCGLVLARHKDSRRYLLHAAMFGLPLLAVGALAFMLRGRMATAAASLPSVVTALVLVVAGLGAVILISGALHCLIRAFECGRNDTTNA
jgi:hypothetical protein